MKKDVKLCRSRFSIVLLCFALIVGSVGCSLGPDNIDTAPSRAVTYTEDFSNVTSTSTSYISGSFTGNNGIAWSYNGVKWNVSLDGKAPCLGKDRDAYVQSGTISGGCGTLSFSYKQPYTTSVDLDVYVNNTLVKSVTLSSSGSSSSTSVTVNQSGDFTIKFVQASTSAGQVLVDNISWTTYGDSSSSTSSSTASGSYTEDFSNVTSTSYSYISGSFTGNNGIAWSYSGVKWNLSLDGKAPCLAKGASPLAYVQSGTISGGCGTLSFSYKQPYSTSVDLDVYVNNTLVKSVTLSSSGSSSSTSVTVNQSGDFTIKFVQASTSAGQVLIDNISWSTYDGSSSTSSSSSSSSSVSTTDTITIASFNIQNFGTTKMGRDNVFNTLAKIVARYDLVAIQEFSNSDGTVIAAFLSEVNSVSSYNYAYIWAASGDEQYAYFYRTSKVQVQGTPYVYSGSKSFSRPPYVAYFKTVTGNFDFVMVNIHTSPSLAETEIPNLQSVMADAKSHFNESDVLCVGDYNADGSYFDEGTSTSSYLSGWSTSSYLTIIPNSFDTTVATSDNTYDRMQMTISGSEDYAGSRGVLKFSDYYNISSLEGATTTAGTELALSDHYPVWATFYTGRDTD